MFAALSFVVYAEAQTPKKSSQCCLDLRPKLRLRYGCAEQPFISNLRVRSDDCLMCLLWSAQVCMLLWRSIYQAMVSKLQCSMISLVLSTDVCC